MKHADVFKSNGVIKGLYFCKPSGNRGPSLNYAVTGKKSTMLSAKDKDFDEVYKRAVLHIAMELGIGTKTKLFAEMLASSDAFLAANGLQVVPVTTTYDQVSCR